MVRVTVVICTRKRAGLLRRCLEAVSRMQPAPTMVLVVDNSEGDGDTERLVRDFGARYTVEPNLGLSYARKRGLMESGTETAAFLDDHEIPPMDWLNTLPPARPLADVAELTTDLMHIDLRKLRG